MTERILFRAHANDGSIDIRTSTPRTKSPHRFYVTNEELVEKLIHSGVSIKVLINADQFEKDIYFPSYTNHDKIARKDFYRFAKKIGIEVRETDHPLTRTIIIDDEVILLNNRIGGHQIPSFVYRKNKTEMSFYTYQFDLFRDIWNISKEI